jgi:hypothetical protein
VSGHECAEARHGNYIDLLHEKTDERRIAGISAAARYPIMDHMLDLVVALFGAAA